MTGGLNLLGLAEIKLSGFREDISDQTSSDGLSSFSQGESRSFGNSDREVQFSADSKIISWLGDLHVFGQANLSSSICRLKVQLRSVSRAERIDSASFFGFQDVDVGLND